jgi:hypothetical protein
MLSQLADHSIADYATCIIPHIVFLIEISVINVFRFHNNGHRQAFNAGLHVIAIAARVSKTLNSKEGACERSIETRWLA